MTSSQKETQFLEFIENTVKKFWAENQRPYLLSQIIPEFIKNGHDGFKLSDITTHERLRVYLEEAKKNGKLKIKFHIPEVAAKISLYPNDVSSEIISDKKEIVLGFLSIINNLDEEDKKQIIIPTYLIAKLLK